MKQPHGGWILAFILAFVLVVAPALEAQRRTTWAPDGGRLALTTGRDAEPGIYVVNADGTDLTRPYSSGSRDAYPSWSPDGSHIAFSSNADGDGEIYIMDTRGENLRQVTHNEDADSYPSWSPDGTAIAFMSNRSGTWQVFVMNADGSSQRRVTWTATNEYNPEWSPDGTTIVFESDRHGDHQHGEHQDEIYVIRVDGSGERRLTSTAANDIFPSWSPDGGRIAFCSIEQRRATIHFMGLDGGTRGSPIEDACLPAWAPDGSRLAFERAGGDAPGIYVVTLDGGDVRRIVP